MDATEQSSQTIRVLYVDDYPPDRELVRDALSQNGAFRLTETDSQQEFESQLAAGGFDVVLSDFNILGFEGLQVIDMVRERCSDIPVVIVTGTGSEELAVQAWKRGAADYVIKTPSHIRRLPNTIHSVLEKRQLETQRSLDEQARQASERRFRNLAESSLQGVLVHRDFKPLFVNEARAKMQGFTVDEFLQIDSLLKLIAPQDQERVVSEYAARIKGEGAPVSRQLRGLRKDGSLFWVENLATVIQWDGEPAIQTTAVDITEQKEADDMLQESETRYRALFEQSSDGVVVVDPETGVVLEFSDRAPLHLGYTREEFAQLDILDIEALETLAEFKKHVDLIAVTGSGSFETKHRTKQGDIRDVEVRATRITVGGQPLVQGVWTDTTERKQASQYSGRAAIVRNTDRDAADDSSVEPFDEVLHALALQARVVIDAHQSAISYFPDGSFQTATHTHSFSKKYEEYNGYDVRPAGEGEDIWRTIVENKVPIRMTTSELVSHAAWKKFSGLKDTLCVEHPPMRGWLAVPILRQNGDCIGVLQLTDRFEGDFTLIDQARLVQLAEAIAPTFELQRTSSQVKRDRQLLKTILQQAADGIVVYDEQKNPTFVNAAARRMALCDPNDTSLPFEDATGWGEPHNAGGQPLGEADKAVSRALLGETMVGRELRMVRDDGSHYDVRMSTASLDNEHGDIIGAVATYSDITERKQAEQELRNSEDKNRRILEASIGAIYIYDIELGRNNYINPQYTALTGYTLEQINAMTANEFFALFHPDDQPRIAAHMQSVSEGLSNGENSQIDYRFKSVSGDWAWYTSCDAVFERDSDGKARQMIGTFIDITDRKQAEQALQVAEAKYRDLYDNAPDMCVSVEAATERIIECNHTLVAATGYTKEEIIGRHVREMYQPECLERLKNEVFPSFGEKGEVNNAELRLKRKDGTSIEVSLNISAVRDGQGDVAYRTSSWRDVTDRKLVERKLTASEVRYRRLMESANDAIVIAEADTGRIVDANRRAEQLMKYSRRELLAMHQSELHLPEEAEKYIDLFRKQVKCGGGLLGDVFVVDQAGRHIPVEISASVIELNGARFIQGIFRDLTERKQAEESLRRAERLASVGTLAAGIAHEINNPISAAWTAAIVALELKDNPNSGDLFDEALHAVVDSVRRCDRIIQNVLRLSRNQSSDKAPHDINDVVRSCCETTRAFATRRDARVILRLADDLPQPIINAVEIEQVLANLIHNAIEAGQGVAEITVSTAVVGDTVSCSVQDKGKGMSDFEQTRIFDPFYTARADGTGVGLGLSIAFGIIQEHGGSIELESKVGKGSTVTINLPFAAAIDVSDAE